MATSIGPPMFCGLSHQNAYIMTPTVRPTRPSFANSKTINERLASNTAALLTRRAVERLSSKNGCIFSFLGVVPFTIRAFHASSCFEAQGQRQLTDQLQIQLFCQRQGPSGAVDSGMCVERRAQRCYRHVPCVRITSDSLAYGLRSISKAQKRASSCRSLRRIAGRAALRLCSTVTNERHESTARSFCPAPSSMSAQEAIGGDSAPRWGEIASGGARSPPPSVAQAQISPYARVI
ncbi:hypothetical protein BV25DRAFT_1710503 [Artomyces pyxidatus]|uniref:Uncharacterized protein n=1 Tax=Artomyces pyxidatus TaxID=48021 RepID=A0ACB8TBS9_9AGAM|nr:hypothetical protein BV25DRAFT_1710503 [Artomyces pyxidatus]